MTGTVVGHIHAEALTDDCICPRLDGCGGINEIDFSCPEHGYNCIEIAKIHSHPLQEHRAYAVDV